MKIYYIQVKNSQPIDVCFWDKDIVLKNETLSCLAFFYHKSSAEKYKDFLEEEDSEIKFEVKSVSLTR